MPTSRLEDARQRVDTRHPEVCRRPCDADVEVLVQQFGHSLRELVDADKERGLELEALDVLEVEHTDAVFVAEVLAVQARDHVDVVVEQEFSQLFGQAANPLITVDEHSHSWERLTGPLNFKHARAQPLRKLLAV